MDIPRQLCPLLLSHGFDARRQCAEHLLRLGEAAFIVPQALRALRDAGLQGLVELVQSGLGAAALGVLLLKAEEGEEHQGEAGGDPQHLGLLGAIHLATDLRRFGRSAVDSPDPQGLLEASGSGWSAPSCGSIGDHQPAFALVHLVLQLVDPLSNQAGIDIHLILLDGAPGARRPKRSRGLLQLSVEVLLLRELGAIAGDHEVRRAVTARE